MKTASIFDAKTNLSKYISALISKKEPSIVIVRNGNPVARLIPYEPDPAGRIGAGKGILPQLASLDEFNALNEEISEEFAGNGGLFG